MVSLHGINHLWGLVLDSPEIFDLRSTLNIFQEFNLHGWVILPLCFVLVLKEKMRKLVKAFVLSGFMSNPCRILHSGCIFVGWPGFHEIKKICQLSEEVQLRYQFVIISEMWSSVELTFHWNHYSQHCAFETACFAKECCKWSVWD